MRYSWDPLKDAINRRKHRLALVEGIPALEDPNNDFDIDDSLDYGETRYVTLGMGWNQILVVVNTMRTEDETRIISVREANEQEREKYYRR